MCSMYTVAFYLLIVFNKASVLNSGNNNSGNLMLASEIAVMNTYGLQTSNLSMFYAESEYIEG